MERYTLEEAAEIMGISSQAIRQRIKRGVFKTVKEGGRVYVLLESTQDADEVDATDAARRKAEELGIDLSRVPGTGPGGGITDDDVMYAAISDIITKGGDTQGVRWEMDDQGRVVSVRSASGKHHYERMYDEEEAADLSDRPNLPSRVLPRRTYTSSHRFNVVFSEPAYDTLRRIARDSGKTISDVVRDAIALQKWFNDTRRDGGHILVDKRGRVREIINIR